jgi:peroxiredoxin
LSDPGLKTALAFGVAMQGEEIAVPATFIVTKDKRIVYVKVGESLTDRPSVADLLEQLDALK